MDHLENSGFYYFLLQNLIEFSGAKMRASRKTHLFDVIYRNTLKYMLYLLPFCNANNPFIKCVCKNTSNNYE